MERKKVLLIGWDAADWKIIHPLMDEGWMPSLKSLVENGVSGKIATLDPPLSPMLWTSIATGKRPYKHGIHGFTEVAPGNAGIRPMYITSRNTKAVWNILNQNDINPSIVGWWPSHPAEPINGVMISNFYQKAETRPDAAWQLMNGAVHPAEKADFYAKLRVHPEEILPNHVLPFVPDLYKADLINDKRIGMIRKNLADSSTIHCAGTYIAAHEEWDFLAVYFDAIDHFCHAFMKYHPPYRDFISRADFDMYKDVVAGAYKFHDMILGRYLELIPEDTTVIVMSDHGFHPGVNRPEVLPDEPTAPAYEHSPFGIFVMKGPGIKKDETVFGVSLLDVAPTILQLYDLPIGQDMDGKVIQQAFENPKPIQSIVSWDEVKGNDGCHPPDLVIPHEDVAADLKQLIDLGYIADPGPNLEKAIDNTIAENEYNLARAYFNGNQWDEGIEILEKLTSLHPGVLRFQTYLFDAYVKVGKIKAARILFDKIESAIEVIMPEIDLIHGTLMLAEKKPVKALELFKKVEAEAGSNLQLKLKLANAYFLLFKYKQAEALLEEILQVDPESFGSWYLYGQCAFQEAEYEKAAALFLRAIGLLYYHPPSHYYLGESLLAMQKYREAANAFEVCLQIAPYMNYARLRLISIYELNLPDPQKVLALKNNLSESTKGEMILVSGLPRSGTSMMMQMLAAGGVPVFTDNERQADENNEKGYLEHEAVKNLAKNKDWLPLAVNKAVKVIAQLLAHLPLNYKYKVIFMERHLVEVITSQHKMLYRLGKMSNADNFSFSLMQTYEKTLTEVKEWLAKHENIEVLYVPYDAVLNTPEDWARQIQHFLQMDLDVDAMIKVVDAGMKRENVNNLDNNAS
ncbi:MAG: alkaline phosphatase family protein [Saprospiraceae bacterium]|nr:alkaline phosphatase family protein [Saprospiraceae bacterium]MBK8849854.1 alkaline phosphatase family protein [Saprospiraceae bacterium]